MLSNLNYLDILAEPWEFTETAAEETTVQTEDLNAGEMMTEKAVTETEAVPAGGIIAVLVAFLVVAGSVAGVIIGSAKKKTVPVKE
ncbi:MAG: hypothetical protein J6F31_00035 [Oscillospiraceae bacterium]|nr:hypothetical protein [Oscillospiraceae bacterium]